MRAAGTGRVDIRQPITCCCLLTGGMRALRTAQGLLSALHDHLWSLALQEACTNKPHNPIIHALMGNRQSRTPAK